MARYNTKVTDYGYKEKIQIYSDSVVYDTTRTNNVQRTSYENMPDIAKEESDKRRINYYRHKLHTVTEIALMNMDFDSMITLTFKNPVTNYDIAIEEWKLFIKRLQYYCSKQSIQLKYIGTCEKQQNRGNVLHFHFLTNTGYIKHETLEKLWHNGFVYITKIGKSEYDRRKAIGYTLKYCLKQIMEEIENKDSRGKRYIFTSNNLLKPTVTKTLSSETIEDIIFAHMEDILTDGQYYITDNMGRKIGNVAYVEYQK